MGLLTRGLVEGCLARNGDGSFLWVPCKRMKGLGFRKVTEAKALSFVVDLVEAKGSSDYYVESDTQGLVKTIRSGK